MCGATTHASVTLIRAYPCLPRLWQCHEYIIQTDGEEVYWYTGMALNYLKQYSFLYPLLTCMSVSCLSFSMRTRMCSPKTQMEKTKMGST